MVTSMRTARRANSHLIHFPHLPSCQQCCIPMLTCDCCACKPHKAPSLWECQTRVCWTWPVVDKCYLLHQCPFCHLPSHQHWCGSLCQAWACPLASNGCPQMALLLPSPTQIRRIRTICDQLVAWWLWCNKVNVWLNFPCNVADQAASGQGLRKKICVPATHWDVNSKDATTYKKPCATRLCHLPLYYTHTGFPMCISCTLSNWKAAKLCTPMMKFTDHKRKQHHVCMWISVPTSKQN